MSTIGPSITVELKDDDQQPVKLFQIFHFRDLPRIYALAQLSAEKFHRFLN